MRSYFLSIILLSILVFFSCSDSKEQTDKDQESQSFKYKVDQFADLQILRYKVPGFDGLSLDQKKLIYYLYKASLSGRDIVYDQNYEHNLLIRKTLEAIVAGYKGSRSSEEWQKIMQYAKRFWFSNGIHHHYSTKKLKPDFTDDYFRELVMNNESNDFPLQGNMTKDDLLDKLIPIIFDPKIATKRVNKDAEADKVAESANNFYGDLTEKEARDFYQSIKDSTADKPVAYGLNSKLVKDSAGIYEKYWKIGGMYSNAISEIVFWLEKASKVAENDAQKKGLELLVDYYQTGNLKTWDDYNIAWVADTAGDIDYINGFIEVYGDPLGYKATYESLIELKDFESSERMQTLSKNAQWFEDNSSIMDEHKKEKVVGISYNVVNVVAGAGDVAPSSPIGINLPNSNWIRAEHGSKSVSLGNILEAYEKAAGSGSLEEFANDSTEVMLSKKYGTLADKLSTALHEVIGHASGKLNEGVGTPKETMKEYASTLEEARADLVALYFILDKKIEELGLGKYPEIGKAEYDGYIRNGLMLQLRRLELGDNIEEDHMRNRQLIAKWVYEKGKEENIIEKITRNGKTYFNINDYQKLRNLFGQLLREIQRIKSEGDYEAGKALVENFGVKVDSELHQEVLTRYERFEQAPYSGFIQPELVAVKEGDKIVNIKINYPEDFVKQMLKYGIEYSFLPVKN